MSAATAIFVTDEVRVDRHGDEFRGWAAYAGDDDGEPVDGFFVRASSRNEAILGAEGLLDKYGVSEIVTD